jgi:hypothetical protein
MTVVVAAAAVSGRWRRRICGASAEGCQWWRGIGSSITNNDALLGLRCLDPLALLGTLCSDRVVARPLTHWLAMHPCNTEQMWGGGAEGGREAVALDLLGLRWVQAADASALAVRLRPRAKMGGGQCPSTCAAPLRPRAKMGGGAGELALLGLRCGWHRTRLGGGVVAFALLRLLGLRLLAFAVCWG